MMNIRDKPYFVVAIIFVFSVGLLIFIITENTTAESQTNNEIQIIDKLEYTTTSQSQQSDHDFTLNVSGGIHHGDYIEIFGTVPDKPDHLTGLIYSGEKDSKDVKIVYVFQLNLDDQNHYSEKVRINDDYLWEKNKKYTVSVNHGDVYKVIQFYRGSADNNLEYNIIP